MDDKLLSLIADAGSPDATAPALNRALVDAWSMTSLPEHTGRPGKSNRGCTGCRMSRKPSSCGKISRFGASNGRDIEDFRGCADSFQRTLETRNLPRNGLVANAGGQAP